MRVGDRIYLTGDHPWAGSSGKIISSFTFPGLDWEVLLDEGDYANHQVAAAESQMQPERRT